MNSLTEQRITCPYCGEMIDVLIDAQDESCEYIEDCQVCCSPIVFHISILPNGEFDVSVRSENDTF
ncbi:MAG: CPXCG motif-containing cysteine-rich protein [Pseudomonadota bacterium]